MNSLTSIALVFSVCSVPVLAQNRVLVIESQSYNAGHTMDTRWTNVATGAGYTVTAGTQADLAGTAFHANADILVVSHGVIAVPPPAQNSIAAFLAQGGHVYLQGEYVATYDTNQLFASLVNANGGTFTWTTALTGDLQPVSIGAPLNGPLVTQSLNYFWYGVTGTGTGITAAMQDTGGNDVGWTFQHPSGARLIHTCDQDWLNNPSAEDPVLMENMLSYLSNGAPTVPTSYCDPANANSISATGAVLTSNGGFGTASAAFLITNLPNTPGLLFGAPNTGDAPFGCGRLCLGGATTLGSVQFAAGNQVSATFDMSIMGTVNIQYWYRDPANLGSCGSTFNLSNALKP